VRSGPGSSEARSRPWHIDVGQAIIRLLLPEQVESYHYVGIRETEQSVFIEIGSIDMTDHNAVHVRAMRLREVRDLLGLIGMTPRVNIHRRAGFPHLEQRAHHQAFFETDLGRLTADLADDAHPDVCIPGVRLNLIGDFRRELFRSPDGISDYIRSFLKTK
jgi:hypothetical protein